MPGNRQDAPSVRHDDVLAFADDLEARLLECPDRLEMRNAREAWALHRDLNLANVGPTSLLSHHRQVLMNGGADVVEGLVVGCTLRPAAGQARYGYRHPFFRPDEHDFVFMVNPRALGLG